MCQTSKRQDTLQYTFPARSGSGPHGTTWLVRTAASSHLTAPCTTHSQIPNAGTITNAKLLIGSYTAHHRRLAKWQQPLVAFATSTTTWLVANNTAEVWCAAACCHAVAHHTTPHSGNAMYETPTLPVSCSWPVSQDAIHCCCQLLQGLQGCTTC
jgi:hypothetical protein